MIVKFAYNEDRDVDCLITKGGGSTNAPGQKTKTYEQLLSYTDKVNDREIVREFVRKHIKDEQLNPEAKAAALQKHWDPIGGEFEKRAEKAFGLSMSDEITAFLTIAGRYPYSIEHKFFFVSLQRPSANPVAMHELWHFYTYRKFGASMEAIGSAKFNDIKESLSVLLNIECLDLLDGEIDHGYPQHQALRKIISAAWRETKDMEKVWATALAALPS